MNCYLVCRHLSFRLQEHFASTLNYLLASEVRVGGFRLIRNCKLLKELFEMTLALQSDLSQVIKVASLLLLQLS